MVYNCHLRTYGELHHLVGTCIHNMGVVYLHAGLYDRAKSAFEKAISIRKSVLGANHMDVAVSLFIVAICRNIFFSCAKFELIIKPESLF